MIESATDMTHLGLTGQRHKAADHSVYGSHFLAEIVAPRRSREVAAEEFVGAIYEVNFHGCSKIGPKFSIYDRHGCLFYLLTGTDACPT